MTDLNHDRSRAGNNNQHDRSMSIASSVLPLRPLQPVEELRPADAAACWVKISGPCAHEV